jgi:hypothetical protein
MSRGMAIEYLEWRPVERRVQTRVVPVLGETEPPKPLAGARVDEAAEERFKALIHPLRLPVRLRMVR